MTILGRKTQTRIVNDAIVCVKSVTLSFEIGMALFRPPPTRYTVCTTPINVHTDTVTTSDANVDPPPDCVLHLMDSPARTDTMKARKRTYAYENAKYCPKFCIDLQAKYRTPSSGTKVQLASGMDMTFQMARSTI